MTPVLRYPPGPITPAGACHLLSGDKPMMSYLAPDGTVVFNLLGPLSYHDPTQPESVRILGLKGLIPPWKQIKQKGATQDGETYVTSLYDPLDVELTVLVRGRDPSYTRKVKRAWIDSWDPKTPGELAWFTHELGRWWADVQWSKTPPYPMMGGTFTRQKFTWFATAYNAFWRSYDSTDTFSYTFDTTADKFTTAYATDMGPNWTLAYTNTNGYAYIADDTVNWSPSSTVTVNNMAARRVGYTSSTDNQVVTITLGQLPNWPWSASGYDDIWVRMANAGTPGVDGVRLRIGTAGITLSSFNSGVETVLHQPSWWDWAWIWPFASEQYTLIAGTENSPREYILQRNGAVVFDTIETGTTSQIGSGFRSVGLGMGVGVDTFLWLGTGQGLPATISDFAAGDNVVTSSGTNLGAAGFVTLSNCGDQPMWPRFTCFGPGTFNMGNGPGATDMVSFGPLLTNQVAQIQTDPRIRGVVDLTSVPPTPQTPQQVGLLQQLLNDLLGFLTQANAPSPALSVYGIPAPQGNLYSLLSGRFSESIGPKSPGLAAQPVQIPVSITGGNAASRILAAGTPLRRYPE